MHDTLEFSPLHYHIFCTAPQDTLHDTSNPLLSRFCIMCQVGIINPDIVNLSGADPLESYTLHVIQNKPPVEHTGPVFCHDSVHAPDLTLDIVARK